MKGNEMKITMFENGRTEAVMELVQMDQQKQLNDMTVNFWAGC